jgi:hypothetical protein
MTSLSLARLSHTLERVGMTVERLAAMCSDPACLCTLIARQARLDDLQLLIGRVETDIGHTVGWPRLVVELDDHALEFVSSTSAIDALAAAQKVSAEDAAWLRLELREQLSRWWTAARARGLVRLRRREVTVAAQRDADFTRFMTSAASSIGDVLVRLVLLTATLEPGPVSDALEELAAALASFIG